MLEAIGATALATTSSGFAASLGRPDMTLQLDELVHHVASLAASVALPVNVDAERLYADTPAGVAASVERLAAAGASGISIEDWYPAAGRIDALPAAAARRWLLPVLALLLVLAALVGGLLQQRGASSRAAPAEPAPPLAAAGASGISIEDWDPAAGRIDSIPDAVARVRAAADACARHGIVLTGRAENLLRGVDDLDDTIERLRAYQQAGATCVYAPGLARIDDIRRVTSAVDAPVNILMRPGVPPVPELAAAGVRRVSTGGGLAWAAYGAMVEAARELLGPGTAALLSRGLDADVRAAALRR
jgi:2-methylisocitrate lyase-like PEP mutase family enzyme